MRLLKLISSKILLIVLTILISSVSRANQPLTDARGFAVYTYSLDHGSNSQCYNSCAVTWPPVKSLGKVINGLGLTRRTDGSSQATLGGMPLYYYIGDSAPGETNGDGLDGIWHIINN